MQRCEANHLQSSSLLAVGLGIRRDNLHLGGGRSGGRSGGSSSTATRRRSASVLGVVVAHTGSEPGIGMVTDSVEVGSPDGGGLGVSDLKVLDAGQLEVLAALVVEDLVALGGAANLHLGKEGTKMLLVVVTVGTAVMISGVGGISKDNLGAVVRGVAGTLALLTVHVSDVVRVVLVELLGRHDLAKLALEDEEGFLHGQTGTLEEESVLESTPVLQLVVALETRVKLGHTQRHGPLGIHVHVLGRELLGTEVGLVVGTVILAGVLLVHRLEEGSDTSRLTGNLGECRAGHNEALGQSHAELGSDDGHDATKRDVGETSLDVGLTVGNQVQGLHKGYLVVDLGDEFGRRHGLTTGTTRHREELLTETILLGITDAIKLETGPMEEGLKRTAGLGCLLEPVLEQGAFLREEPAAQVLGAAVGGTEDEVRADVLVLVAVAHLLGRELAPRGRRGRGGIDVKVGLDGLVELHPVGLAGDVASLELLDLAEDLETGQGQLLKLVEAELLGRQVRVKVQVVHHRGRGGSGIVRGAATASSQAHTAAAGTTGNTNSLHGELLVVCLCDNTSKRLVSVPASYSYAWAAAPAAIRHEICGSKIGRETRRPPPYHCEKSWTHERSCAERIQET